MPESQALIRPKRLTWLGAGAGAGARANGWLLACASVLALGGCAGNPHMARGRLAVEDAPRTAAFDAAEMGRRLANSEEGRWIAKQVGAPACGVDVYHYQYHTVDGRGQPTNASSALMLPTGNAPECAGHRPVVLWAHGTQLDRTANQADISGTNPGSARAFALAGMFAAHGYIVVAPNYAGYDTSTLPYHPYFIVNQQAKDMVDAWSSARALLAKLSIKPSDKVFIHGHSQGGSVAMATQRELQAAGTPPTAVVASSGAYALAASVDDMFMGRPVHGANLLFPMGVTAIQKSWGNVYRDPAEFYNPKYAAHMETLLPSTLPFAALVKQGKVPPRALFDSTPPEAPANADGMLRSALIKGTPDTSAGPHGTSYASAFGSDPMIRNEARLAYMQDVLAHPDGAVPVFTTGAPSKSSRNPLRQGFIKSDLRSGWIPSTPLMLCGGHEDAMVSFPLNTELMMRYWSAGGTAAPKGMVTMLDLDAAPAADDPHADLKRGYASLRDQMRPQLNAETAIAYHHQVLVPRLCMAAARQRFDRLR